MSFRGCWSGGELHWLVAVVELHVKVGAETLKGIYENS